MPEPTPIVLSRYVLVFCAVRRAALVLAADTVSERDYRRARAIVRADPDDRGVSLPHPRTLRRLVRGDWAAVLRVALMSLPHDGADGGPGARLGLRDASRGSDRVLLDAQWRVPVAHDAGAVHVRVRRAAREPARRGAMARLPGPGRRAAAIGRT